MEKFDAKNPEHWIPREVFAAYCGEESVKLLAYYDAAVVRKNPMTTSFDLLAFLLLPAWLAYRQQWAMWATLTVLMTALPFIEFGSGFEIPSGAFIGIWTALGLLARGIFLGDATRRYRKLAESGLEASSIKEVMAGRARGHVLLAVIGGTCYLVAVVAAVLLAASLFPESA